MYTTLFPLTCLFRSVRTHSNSKYLRRQTDFLQVTYIDEKRKRVSSESAYLTEEVLARPNLKVVVRATVTKIITETSETGIRAVGVEFAQTKSGPRFRVRAKREVILSYVLLILRRILLADLPCSQSRSCPVSPCAFLLDAS